MYSNTKTNSPSFREGSVNQPVVRSHLGATAKRTVGEKGVLQANHIIAVSQLGQVLDLSQSRERELQADRKKMEEKKKDPESPGREQDERIAHKRPVGKKIDA